MHFQKNQNKSNFFQIKISGIIAFPKAMLNDSPIWCTKCTEDICPNHMKGTSEEPFTRCQWCVFTSFGTIRFFVLNFYLICIFISQCH